MKKFTRFLNEYSFYILLIIIFISFLIINLNVVYFGDDYYFLQYRNYNIIEHFKHLFSFYCTDNGRFIVHLLVTTFLKLPMIFWQIVNSMMLTGICFFTFKIVTANGKNNNFILVTLFFLISSIEIMVTRQSVYWLTGSFNYVYPCLMLLIYTYLLTKIENKKYYTATIIMGFLSSATMEQPAMMTFGLTLLVFLSKFKDLKKIKQTIRENKRLLLLVGITLFGACTVLLAPAQFYRIKIETEKFSLLNNMVENIKLIFSFYTRTATAVTFGIILNLFALSYVLQNEENKKAKYFICSSIILVICLFIANYFMWERIRILRYLLILLFGINLLFLNKKIYHKVISSLTIAIVLLLGSQLMMVVSPVLGYRNFIFGLIAYLFIIELIISKVNIKPHVSAILGTCFLLIALFYNFNTAKGYYQTKLVNEKNIEIIQNNKRIISNKNLSITLYQYPDENYAWSMPYWSDFHIGYYKKLYGIECEINWE